VKLDPVDLVIKLGGSAITYKDSEFSANIEVLESITKELSGWFKAGSEKTHRVIIIYGGGSFGHFVARKYVENGAITSPNGFAEIRAAMLSLTKIITETFLRFDLPLFCINPSSCFVLRGGRIDVGGYFLEPVTRALEYGLIPALGGDIVLDQSGNAHILSGDTIARLLAITLRARALAFGTDVDGVLTGEGKMIKNLRAGELSSLLHVKGRSGDVTGGMAGKVGAISTYMSEGGKLAIVFNITKPGLLTDILKGKRTKATYIAADPSYLPK